MAHTHKLPFVLWFGLCISIWALMNGWWTTFGSPTYNTICTFDLTSLEMIEEVSWTLISLVLYFVWTINGPYLSIWQNSLGPY